MAIDKKYHHQSTIKEKDHKILCVLNVIQNNKTFFTLQFPHPQKIYNELHFNWFQKSSTKPLIGQLNNLPIPFMVINEKE